MNTLTIEQMKALVEACTYKPGWQIIFDNDGERPFVQVAAATLCSVSGEPTAWKSGKTYLSPYMCRQEVVSAVYGTIEKAELHEIREFFRYKGASIFNPHLDPDVLAEVAKKKESFNVRDNAMSMVESKRMLVGAPFTIIPNSFKFVAYNQHDKVYDCKLIDKGRNAGQYRVSWDWDDCGKCLYTQASVGKQLTSGNWTIKESN